MFNWKKKTTKKPQLSAADSRRRHSSDTGLRALLSATRSRLFDRLGQNDELLHDLEARLLAADVGFSVSESLMAELRQSLPSLPSDPGRASAAVIACLRTMLLDRLRDYEQELQIDHRSQPFVILVIGVNGSGKTTTIGKLAAYYKRQGHSVMLAAGDTFRAGAIEQIKTWGERAAVPVVAQKEGADSAAVLYDAMASAQAKSIDVLLADTAGRLHNKDNLMREMSKIKRVLAKHSPAAPQETMLVIDANNGQNALTQVRRFHGAVGITGVTVSKMDGSAKAGIVLAIAEEMKTPLRFVTTGTHIEDLHVFSAAAFVDGLLATN